MHSNKEKRDTQGTKEIRREQKDTQTKLGDGSFFLYANGGRSGNSFSEIRFPVSGRIPSVEGGGVRASVTETDGILTLCLDKL